MSGFNLDDFMAGINNVSGGSGDEPWSMVNDGINNTGGDDPWSMINDGINSTGDGDSGGGGGGLWSFLGNMFGGGSGGNGFNWGSLLQGGLPLAGGLLSALADRNSGGPPPVGYQGGIPDYTAVRQRVPIEGTYNAARRPGSGGMRYFSDMQYAEPSEVGAARQLAQQQVQGLGSLNITNPAQQGRPGAQGMSPEQRQSFAEELFGDAPQYSPIGARSIAGSSVSQPEPTAQPEPNMSLQSQLSWINDLETSPSGQKLMPWPLTAAELDEWRSSGKSHALALYNAQLDGSDQSDQSDQGTLSDLEQRERDYEQRMQRYRDNWLKNNLQRSRPVPQPDDDEEAFTPLTDAQLAEMRARGELDIGGAKARGGRVQLAQGGIASVAPKGRYLAGPTDGMADKVPATINGRKPAALSDGEFVVTADVVSDLGNGNSDAGAEVLHKMMERVRRARHGSPKQGRRINPNQHLPR